MKINTEINIHLTIDDKFIDSFIENSKMYSGNENIFLVYTKNNKLKYIKHTEDVIIVDSREGFYEVVNNYNNVRSLCLHWLSEFAVHILTEIPAWVRVIMFFWGGEIFELSIFQKKFLYQKNTRNFLAGRLNYLEAYNKNFENQKINALSRINYFAHYLMDDYLLIKRTLNFPAEFLYFAYPLKLRSNQINFGRIPKNRVSILLGNSADPANNHIDALILLKEKDIYSNFEIICPLSYGIIDGYVEEVIRVGTDLFNERFTPLKDFIPIERYNQMLEDLDIAVFNHIRSQAAWNIFKMLHSGKRVYLNEKSNLYAFIKKKGGVINSLREINIQINTNSFYLNNYEQDVNRYLVENHYSDKKNELIFKTLLDEDIEKNKNIFNSVMLVDENHAFTHADENSKQTVSAVIPAYNREKFLPRAVKSILSQTVKVDEIIIVDDSSTDGTDSLIRAMQKEHSQIKHYKTEKNCGAQAARNIGIRNSASEWIGFLDSDDEWLPGRVEQALKKAREENADVTHCSCYRKEQGKPLQKMNIPPLQGNIRIKMLEHPASTFPGLFLRKNCFNRIGLLDESIVAWQEWDTYIRLSKVYEFAFIDEPLFIWHWHADETISKSPLKDVQGYYQVVEKYKNEIIDFAGVPYLVKHYLLIAEKFLKLNRKKELLEIKSKLEDIKSQAALEIL